MLLLELAQARLGQADAHGEGSGGGVKRGGGQGSRGCRGEGRFSRTPVDAVLARLGQILLGWEVSLCLMSHFHGYDLLKYHKRGWGG